MGPGCCLTRHFRKIKSCTISGVWLRKGWQKITCTECLPEKPTHSFQVASVGNDALWHHLWCWWHVEHLCLCPGKRRLLWGLVSWFPKSWLRVQLKIGTCGGTFMERCTRIGELFTSSMVLNSGCLSFFCLVVGMFKSRESFFTRMYSNRLVVAEDIHSGERYLHCLWRCADHCGLQRRLTAPLFFQMGMLCSPIKGVGSCTEKTCISVTRWTSLLRRSI